MLRLLLYLVLFFVYLYFFVPYATRHLIDTKPIVDKLQTTMLPSDQPDIVRLQSFDKKVIRALNLDLYIGVLYESLIALPSVLYNYANITPKHQSITPQSLGIFVDGAKTPQKQILKEIQELNVSSVGIRIYVTREYIESKAYQQNLALARALKAQNRNILLVLAQLRESFDEDLEDNLNRIVDDFAPSVEFYQIAEAINRIKWGILSKEDFTRFNHLASEAIARDKGAKSLGVSVIDFEWFYTIYFNALANERFDIANTLLYVDRVREPENEQLSFDTTEKIRLFKSITPNKALWITEVNWPLKDTGEFKPTSNKEAVLAQEYENYMVRYIVQSFATGFIERIYWWQLYAKGYGLIDHISMQKRSAFEAFKFLNATLSHATLKRNKSDNIFYEYVFAKAGKEFKIAWAKDGFKKHITHATFNCFDMHGKKLEKILVTSAPIICKERE